MNLADIELTAPDISCAKCQANIEGDLSGEPGIEQVTVDVGAKRVHRLRPGANRPGPATGQARRDRIPGRFLSG